MKKITLTLFIMSLFGCASTQNISLTEDKAQSLQGKSLIIVQRETPSFNALTSGKGAFALAGVAAAVSAGNKLVKDNNITDPAMSISKATADKLAQTYNMTLVNKPTGISQSNDIDDIVKLAQDSDYAIDAVTRGWGHSYDGFNFSDYYVGYNVGLRLIDVRNRSVTMSGTCIYDAKKMGRLAVAHEKLIENNAAYIKQELNNAANFCNDQLQSMISNSR